jgi:hypothetical protein
MESFQETLEILNRVLAQHGRPASVVWIADDGLLLVLGRTFARAVRPEIGLERARAVFEMAASQGQALAIQVVGHSTATSFARVEIARDAQEASSLMMSSQHVKVSIPYQAGPRFHEVHSGTGWAVVRLLAG